jgi:hypothetical protein
MQLRDQDSEASSSPQPATTKRPYRTPVLAEYGQVSKLTQGGASIGVDGINHTMMVGH